MAKYTFEFKGPVVKKIEGDDMFYFWETEGMNHYGLDKAKLVALQGLAVKFLADANAIAKAGLEDSKA